MANNPNVNKVIFGGQTLLDLTSDTVTPSSLMQGYTAHDASGTLIIGTASGGSGQGNVWQDAQGYLHLDDESGIDLQTKSVTPSETAQTVTADAGYYALEEVNVGAISSSYVGSGITQRDSDDLTVSGATVTAPSGYYSASASKSVASGSAGTPTATKGTVSNHSVTVTPSVTNTTGYITGGTKTGTAVSVSASELVSGSETKTVNGTYDVTNLAELVVDVAGSTPSGIKYLYSDVDGEGAWTGLDQYEYISYNYAPIKDNKFRFWIKLDSSDLTFKAPVSVPSYAAYRYTGSIDWGDGSPITDFAYGNVDHTHTYAEAGTYCVEIWWTGGSERLSISNLQIADRGKVIAIEFYMLDYPTNTITVALPNLTKVRYSSLQTSVGWFNCTKLEDIILPDSTLTVNGVYGSEALRKLTIPASVTTISGAFNGNTNMEEYHFLPVNPPTVTTTNLFRDIPANCKIYVPSASLSAYQTASNWSTYASYMVGE